MNCCINGGNVIRLLFLSAKLLKFENQKCGQILCAHKPYFLMPGHNFCQSSECPINPPKNLCPVTICTPESPKIPLATLQKEGAATTKHLEGSEK